MVSKREMRDKKWRWARPRCPPQVYNLILCDYDSNRSTNQSFPAVSGCELSRLAAGRNLHLPTNAKGASLMFTRIVECHVKPEKKDEFNNKLRSEVLPILQKQPGFVDLIALASENDPEHMVALSFWNSKQDAERYHQEHFKRITEILKPHLRRDPSVETYNVDTSTTHRIAAGKKAA
jgi:quinol monooxygenase YgiN